MWKTFLAARAQVRPHEHDGGNDLARFFDGDHVTDANVLTCDFLGVMQRRAGDRAPTD